MLNEEIEIEEREDEFVEALFEELWSDEEYREYRERADEWILKGNY